MKMGAPWPADTKAADDKGHLWSLLPVKNPPIPKVKNPKLVKNPQSMRSCCSKLEGKAPHICPAGWTGARSSGRVSVPTPDRSPANSLEEA